MNPFELTLNQQFELTKILKLCEEASKDDMVYLVTYLYNQWKVNYNYSNALMRGEMNAVLSNVRANQQSTEEL